MKSQPFIIRDLFNQYSDIIFCTIWIESFYVRSYVYRQVLFYAKVTFPEKVLQIKYKKYQLTT